MTTESILYLLKSSGLMELARQQLEFLESHQQELARNEKEVLKQVWDFDLKRVDIYEKLLPESSGDEREFCEAEVESILFGGAITLAQAGTAKADLEDIFAGMKNRFPFIDVNEMVEHASRTKNPG